MVCPQDATLLRAEERATALVLLHHARLTGVAAHVALVALVEARAVGRPCAARNVRDAPRTSAQAASSRASSAAERALALQLLSQAGGGAEVRG